jgi:transcriptional regulator with XRE-family HTH domain
MENQILTALRSAIQERGVTIADVAKAAKVNRTTLSLMLSGVKSPTLRTLCRVCGVLGVQIAIINQPAVEMG